MDDSDFAAEIDRQMEHAESEEEMEDSDEESIIGDQQNDFFEDKEAIDAEINELENLIAEKELLSNGCQNSFLKVWRL